MSYEYKLNREAILINDKKDVIFLFMYFLKEKINCKMIYFNKYFYTKIKDTI